MPSQINHIDLGVMRFREALDTQETYWKRALDTGQNFILTVQHPAVVTFGKNASRDHLVSSLQNLSQAGIDVVETDRGGQITAHQPGQLVMYPVLNLNSFSLTPRKYVCFLETLVIAFLKQRGCPAHSDPDHPGVWVGAKKICAIGIRIKKRISMHGLALNLTNDLDVFSHIIPCGIENRSVTSLEKETSRLIKLEAVCQELVSEMRTELDQMSGKIRSLNRFQTCQDEPEAL